MAPDHLCGYLLCPSCGTGLLSSSSSEVACQGCHQRYPIRNGVMDFVLYDQLGETERRELQVMNQLTDDEQKVQWLIGKEHWDRVQTHFHKRAIRAAARILSPYAAAGKTLVTVGSGAGFELRLLEKYVSFSKIIASDISRTAAQAIPRGLQSTSGALGLLACDFQKCPVKFSADTVGFAYEALHHSDDVHRTISTLLNQFEQFVIVEPTRNWFLNAVARFGLSMNTEYSGLKPDWIDLKRLRHTAQCCGYSMEASTWWPVPDWAVPDICRRTPFLGAGLCFTADSISALTKPFNFGAMCIVHFRKEVVKQSFEVTQLKTVSPGSGTFPS